MDGDSRISSIRLIDRFKRFGDLADLQQAITILEESVRAVPISDDRYRTEVANLGLALRCRFNRLGESSDLEEAVARQRDALRLVPQGHPDKPGHLTSLGNSLQVRFERLGEIHDLEEAISLHRDAVYITPQAHPYKVGYLNNLNQSLYVRFQHLGELGDLEEAISAIKEAVDLTPSGHLYKAGVLSNLGNSLKDRFERLWELKDLEGAILALGESVDLTTDGHPDKPGRFNNLGNALRARFERLGDLSDLEDAISRHRGAVDLIPCGHPYKPMYLNNLSRSLAVRFERLGELGDLPEAISILRGAVNITPSGHPNKPVYLVNLGNSLHVRFVCLGEISDLEEAIRTLRDAADLIPRGHQLKPTCLDSLGRSFFARFECLGEFSGLEEAISRRREAVDLTPSGHFDEPSHLSNLGRSLQARFEHFGDLGDLEEAISCHKHAIDLSPRDHPDKPEHLTNLASSLLTRYERLREQSDIEQVISLYSRAASNPTGPTSVRFRASQKWISCARRIRHPTLLHAYSVANSLLPQLAWVGLSLSHRYSELMQGANVVREAAAAALDAGLPEVAVEWLEQGRSIVWGELLQLRSFYGELSSAHPGYAHRLRELSAALERASATREKSLSVISEQTESASHHAAESLQQVADRHRALAIKRDKLLQEIRRLPGFEQFLLHKQFSRLRASAHAGPVVILNAAESRCDALIVLADVNHVIHVPLPNFPFRRSTALQNMLRNFVRQASVVPFDERHGQRATMNKGRWESLFSSLWLCVVKPVLDALAFSTPGDLSRIFWCPTGPFTFLPIHAAGLYDGKEPQPGHKVYDFVISSYVPNLAILMRSPDPATLPHDQLSFLAVRQPPTDGLPHLSGVDIELARIKDMVQSEPCAGTTLLESTVGTVEEVLALMKDAHWVHFTCHGIQDTTDPSSSGLCLADGRRLKLRDIIALSRPYGGLAFLSACQTARGDERLSDEAVHITAGMLYAGYGGVIGTVWSISDRLAPGVAADVYEQLIRNGARPDYRNAARALHEAIRHLRDNNASFVEWLPFIHVGL